MLVRHSQAQWNIYSSPRVHAAFAQIYGTENLWVNFDGVLTMKPPSRRDTPRYNHVSSAGKSEGDYFALGDALPMHWDVAVDDFHENGYRFGTIGFMFLNDRDEFGGQTSIVPRFHRLFNEWASSPAAQNEIGRMRAEDTRQHPDMSRVLDSVEEAVGEELAVKVVAGNAGDLLIFDSFLPHGSGLCTMDTPRATMGMFVTPVPEDEEVREASRLKRIEAFETQGMRNEDGSVNEGVWVPPAEIGRPAKLSALGRKMLGMDEW